MDMMEFPSWSPSGEYIAYECIYYTSDYLINSGNSDRPSPIYLVQDICIQQPNGEGFKRLTTTGGMRYPVWSPNSRYLAWVQGWDYIIIWDSYNSSIKKYPYTGNNLYHFDESWNRIEWSDDNSKLFLQDIGDVLDLDTGNFTPSDINDSSDIYYHSQVWASNGQYLAYIQYEPSEDVISTQHFLTVFDGDEEIIEKTHEALIGDLSWSRDGHFLAWLAYPKGWTQLKNFNRAMAITHMPSGQTQFIELDEIVLSDYPHWSPSGQAFALVTHSEIIILYLNITQSPYNIEVDRQIALPIDNFSHRNPIAWSPDETSIAYSSNDGSIHIVHLNGNMSVLSGN